MHSRGDLRPRCTFIPNLCATPRDATCKRDTYAAIGVTEYWRFDPTGEFFAAAAGDRRLIGERLVDGRYEPIPLAYDPDEVTLRGRSEVLGLDICALSGMEGDPRGSHIRCYDPVAVRMATDSLGRSRRVPQSGSRSRAVEGGTGTTPRWSGLNVRPPQLTLFRSYRRLRASIYRRATFRADRDFSGRIFPFGQDRPFQAKPIHDSFLDALPLNYDDTTLRTVEQIDVLWLKGRSMARAFEIEHTTAIYSGLLRMADLLALQPNMDIRLHIVAPPDKRERVLREIRRPVFSLLDRGPLYEQCSFLPYDSIDQLSEEQHLAHMSDSIIVEYEEFTEV